jgi:nucleoside-diphosphate-sugar epimerase
MKTLVLGAGFLGQEIIKVFKDKNLSVLGSKRSNPKSLQDIIEIDVHKTETFRSIPDEVDQIVYAVSAKSSDSKSYEEAYFLGLRNILDFKKDVKVIFISSTGVYQENGGGEVSESSPVLEGDQKYSHILNAEKLVLEKNGVVLRLSGIYGQGRRYFIEYAKKIETFAIDDLKWTNRIHKTDAANVCASLVDNDFSGILNVSDEHPSINLDCLNYIRSQLSLSEIPLEISPEKVIFGKKCSPTKLTV